MRLDMLLEILRALESLATKVAFVGLERNVDTNVRGYVIPLDGGGTTVPPVARQIEIVCALATDMTITDMVLREKKERSALEYVLTREKTAFLTYKASAVEHFSEQPSHKQDNSSPDCEAPLLLATALL